MRMHVLLTAAWLCVGAAASGIPALIPLDVLARAPDVALIRVSPNGHRLAMIATVDGRGAVMLADADGKGRKLILRDPARSIGNLAWSGDGRWLYVFQDAGGDEGFHLFRIDPDKPGIAIDLTPFKGKRVDPIPTPAASSAMVPITLDRRDPEWPDAYGLDLNTGALTEQVRNTIGATDFFADRSGRVAAATATRADGRLDLLARDKSGRWPVRYSAPPSERFRVVSLTPDGRFAIVRSNRNREAERLVRIDLDDGRQSDVPGGSCGHFDVEGLQFLPDGRIASIDCVTEKATVRGRDPGFASAVEAVRKVAGNDVGLRLESISSDGTVAIFYTEAGDRPGQFFRWSRNGVRGVGSTHPQLTGHQLAKTEHVWLKARDGLPLLAYLTRPVGTVGQVPMIVSIHGGPWTRDSGDYSSETQFLANRGYAVLQVNFRGSTGLGRATFDAGVGEFGRKMSDDIDDAANWAVAQGIAPADRICLLGGSYGGYATLMGLVRKTMRYRCGVDYAGPVDLATLVESFPPGWGPYLPRSWYRFVGDPRKPEIRSALADRSPLANADRITAPLLIFQGANDPRVTQSQSDSVVCALRRRNVAVEYLLAGNEGHSFANEETSLAVNRAVEIFLGAQLGGRVGRPAAPPIEKTLATMKNAGGNVKCAQK